MTRHRILDSLHNISYLQVNDKLNIDHDGILVVDRRVFRDFRRNWNNFSRYDLLEPLQIILHQALLMAEFKIMNQICFCHYNKKLPPPNSPDYLKKLESTFKGLKRMLHTYQHFPELLNIIRESKPIYKYYLELNSKNQNRLTSTFHLHHSHPELHNKTENTPYYQTLLHIILYQPKSSK